MLKIYLMRLEREQKPPLTKAHWHRLGAQEKVPALPLLRKDKGGNFFGKKTNPRKAQQTECFLPPPLPPATPWAASVLSLPVRQSLTREGERGSGHPVGRRAGGREERGWSPVGLGPGAREPEGRPFRRRLPTAEGSSGSIVVGSRRSEASRRSGRASAALGGRKVRGNPTKQRS